MALLQYITLAVLLVAAFTDLRNGLIYNWLTLPAIMIGICLAAWQGGLAGFGNSLLGILVGGGALLPLFASGAMGAGDVKLMAAVGALQGPVFAGETLIMAILIGGAAGIGLLVLQGKLVTFLKWYVQSMASFFKAVFYRGINLALPKSPGFGSAPFALSILLGAVSAYFYDVFYYFRIW